MDSDDRYNPRGTLVGREIIIRESARGTWLNSFVGQEGIVVAPAEDPDDPFIVFWRVEWKRFNPRLPPTEDVPFYHMKSKLARPQEMVRANEVQEGKLNVPMWRSNYNKLLYNIYDIDFPDWCSFVTDFTNFIPQADGDGICRLLGSRAL
jgi:hypothetical protein